MDRSPGFGSTAAYFRPFQTRFRFGSALPVLNLALCRNSLAHSTKGTPSHVLIVLRLFVSIWFQVLFTPLPGFFSPFPHGTMRYRSLVRI